MKTIYKYPLKLRVRQEIQLPEGATILSVGIKDGDICLWAEIDTTNPMKSTLVAIVATGADISELPIPREFLGTVIDEVYVWHLYKIV